MKRFFFEIIECGARVFHDETGEMHPDADAALARAKAMSDELEREFGKMYRYRVEVTEAVGSRIGRLAVGV